MTASDSSVCVYLCKPKCKLKKSLIFLRSKNPLKSMVGTARFELATYGTQNRLTLLFTNNIFVNYALLHGLRFKWLWFKRKLKGG